MSELVATRIREHAERLRLAHLAENLDALLTRAEQATMGYLELVDLLLEEAVGVREGRRFRNALKLSGLPHHKGLDTFDFAFQPDLDAGKVRDLAALGFIQQKANVCFLGPPGVGKTMLAVGLAIAACQAGYSIYFTTLDDLVRNLKEAEASGRFAKKLQTYLKLAVLVLDEVGYLPLARPDANMVFQLVARRYERGSILLTSNKAFSEWAASSATTCWPRPSWTGCCTTATSSRSTVPATGSRTASSPQTEVVPSSDPACPPTDT